MRCAGGSVNDGGMEQSFDPRQVGNANLIYILYLVGVAVPVIGLVGLVLAYNARAAAPPAVDNHYRNQINIFWKALGISLVGVLTFFFLIGVLIFLFGAVWYIIRTVQGMQALARWQVIEDPSSWGFPRAVSADAAPLVR